MPKLLKADDLLPLIALLAPGERDRLLCLITSGQKSPAAIYATMPPRPDEFHTDDDPLSWDAEGREQFS